MTTPKNTHTCKFYAFIKKSLETVHDKLKYNERESVLSSHCVSKQETRRFFFNNENWTSGAKNKHSSSSAMATAEEKLILFISALVCFWWIHIAKKIIISWVHCRL